MRRFLEALFALVLRLFFRRVEVSGLERFPPSGGALVVLNHPSGLIDPLVLACNAPRPVSFLAKEPLFRMPIVGIFIRGLDSIPIYRRQDDAEPGKNRDTLEKARALLARGRVLAIFPEGATHSEPRLRPLKTGAARIALGATSLGVPGQKSGVWVVPAGLTFTSKATFRSAALLRFGEPFELEAVPLGPGGEPPAEAVRELTDRIEESLADVTLQADRAEALALIHRAERIFSAASFETEHDDLDRRFELKQRLLDGYDVLKARAPGRIRKLVGRIGRYESALGHAGLDPENVSEMRFEPSAVVRTAAGFVAASVFVLPAALVGAVLHAPVYALVHQLSRRLAQGDDSILATVKVLSGALFYPLTWLLVAGAAWVRFGPEAAIAALTLTPLSAWAAVLFFERADRFGGSARALRLYLFRRRSFRRLFREQKAIREAIEELGQEAKADGQL